MAALVGTVDNNWNVCFPSPPLAMWKDGNLSKAEVEEEAVAKKSFSCKSPIEGQCGRGGGGGGNLSHFLLVGRRKIS